MKKFILIAILSCVTFCGHSDPQQPQSRTLYNKECLVMKATGKCVCAFMAYAGFYTYSEFNVSSAKEMGFTLINQ